MFFFSSGINKNIIDENDNKTVYKGFEHPIYQVHESSWSICQAK